MTLKAPPLSEADFQRQVMELAHIRGWETMHARPGMTRDSWRTPLSGTMAKGWLDIVLVRVKDQRLLIAELKSEAGTLTPEQLRVRDVIRDAGIEVHVWRPSDWDRIMEVLA